MRHSCLPRSLAGFVQWNLYIQAITRSVDHVAALRDALRLPHSNGHRAMDASWTVFFFIDK
jgi:hypothetical protein